MLVLGRRLGDRVIVRLGSAEVAVIVVDIDRNQIRLGFEADESVTIMRGELVADAAGRGETADALEHWRTARKKGKKK